MWSIYEIIHICTAVVYEVKSYHRSNFSNLSNWKGEAWKNQGFNRIQTRDLRDTSAMLYQLSYEATRWERGQFTEFIFFLYSEGTTSLTLSLSLSLTLLTPA